MKTIFTFLFLLPCICFAQDNPYQYFKLTDGIVTFEKVYEVSDTNTNVERLLTLNVPKIPGIFEYNKTNEIITAKLKGVEIDYKKFGGKWANTWTAVLHPMYADVIIVWKDRKYRVTVSNIIFIPIAASFSLGLTDGMTKKGGTMFDDSKIILRSSKYVETTLSNLFEIKENNDDW